MPGLIILFILGNIGQTGWYWSNWPTMPRWIGNFGQTGWRLMDHTPIDVCTWSWPGSRRASCSCSATSMISRFYKLWLWSQPEIQTSKKIHGKVQSSFRHQCSLFSLCGFSSEWILLPCQLLQKCDYFNFNFGHWPHSSVLHIKTLRWMLTKQKYSWKRSKVGPPNCSQASPPRFWGFSNPSADAGPASSLLEASFVSASSVSSYFFLQNWTPEWEFWSIACWGPGRPSSTGFHVRGTSTIFGAASQKGEGGEDTLCYWYLDFCDGHLSTQITKRQGKAMY